MNTEEAIKFCENVMYKEDVIDCEEDDLLYNEEMRKVITLLQQGEKYEKEYVEREAELYLIIKKTRKYKKIVKELEEFSESKALKLHVKENELWKFELKKIIAKYFPKEPPDEKTTKL